MSAVTPRLPCTISLILRRRPDGNRKPVLGDPETLDEVLHEDLPRVDRIDQVVLSGNRRVRHRQRLLLSKKADAPLGVHPDAVLTSTVTH